MHPGRRIRVLRFRASKIGAVRFDCVLVVKGAKKTRSRCFLEYIHSCLCDFEVYNTWSTCVNTLFCTFIHTYLVPVVRIYIVFILLWYALIVTFTIKRTRQPPTLKVKLLRHFVREGSMVYTLVEGFSGELNVLFQPITSSSKHPHTNRSTLIQTEDALSMTCSI